MQKANVRNLLVAVAIAIATLGVSTGVAWAHCDTESGPTAVDARKALETGSFNIIAIWVGEEQAPELRDSFEESLAVYKMGGKAKALAERYFITTAVRLHRQAEGMQFTGLKPAQPLPPIIAKAETTLEDGNLKPLTDLLSAKLQEQTQKLFQNALEAKKHYNGENVEAGRQWVDAYVKYVIYVNGLHKTIHAGPAHGVGE